MKWIIAVAALCGSGAARADVVNATANGFHLRHEVQIVVPPANAFAAFGQMPNWWNAQHTYSGKSSNLSLSLTPGGCMCERFPDGGGIEHMHVAYVEPGKRAVLTGSLGPLLYLATNGVMDVQFERIAGGTKITLDYKVSGFAEGGADKLAPIVDGVLADQMRRYRQFARARPQR